MLVKEVWEVCDVSLSMEKKVFAQKRSRMNGYSWRTITWLCKSIRWSVYHIRGKSDIVRIKREGAVALGALRRGFPQGRGDVLTNRQVLHSFPRVSVRNKIMQHIKLNFVQFCIK